MKYEGGDEKEREGLEEEKEEMRRKVCVLGSHIRLMLWIAQGRNVTSALFYMAYTIRSLPRTMNE